MKAISFLLVSAIVLFLQCNPPDALYEVEQWHVFGLSLTGPSDGNPYMDNEISATFTTGDFSVDVPGFYDGNGNYKIRFSPDKTGVWKYVTKSNVSGLSNQTGSFECVAPEPDNHGPVKVANTHYLHYADGTPYFAIGTTAYQWTSVSQSIQEQTLQTLAKAPFNKIRMCVFPKTYIYGNETEPWIYPYQRDGEQNDFAKPNYEFFRNFDKRVAQLLEMGIQADVILFHPYDKWGYCEMGDAMNSRYVRYLIARLSAYRNVWWSLANEWDVPKIKETINWEEIGTILQTEDPHQRLRGIHNWYGSEDHFYDHSRQWITHVSTQTSQFYNAIKWREQYKKPLLFDEMRYEGDVPSGWGNLSGEEMAGYFWMAGLSGGYPTHGETLQNDSDTTEVRWWAKGGTLVGKSPERIAYFKSMILEAPFQNMQPELLVNGEAKDLNNNVYILSYPGNYYLAYVANAGETIELELPGNVDYQLEVMDTWNMKVVDESNIQPGKFIYTSTIPYTALRIQKRNG